MGREFIRLEHISKKYKDELVLKDIDAKLHEGEILGSSWAPTVPGKPPRSKS